MARPRSELHAILKGIGGVEEVYFQPPNGLKMRYPCIVYNRGVARTDFAGNKPYLYSKRYEVTVIDKDPDSLIPDEVAALQSCVHNRFFTADNLNHDVFNLYF